MLQAHGLSYEPSPLVGRLFENLNLSLYPCEKVALVGRNGSGKTKLLQILAGLIEPNCGQVILGRGDVIAYLPQDQAEGFTGTLKEFALREGGEPHQLVRAASKLSLSQDLLERPYQLASLGERMRIAIASLLIKEPTILLLDEPTNHLDLEARQWLESFLKTCPQSVLMVCHDREMIDRTMDRVLDLELGVLTEYVGGYTEMLQSKAAQHERQKSEWERSRSEDRRLRNASEKMHQAASGLTKRPTGRDYAPGAKPFYAARAKAVDKRAKAIKKRAEALRAKSVEKPYEDDAVKLEFFSRPLRSHYVLTVRDLSIDLGGRPILQRLNLSVESGSNTALVGPNGCGKTTLLKVLLKELRPEKGEIAWSGDAEIGYLSQSRGRLDPNRPLYEALQIEPSQETKARTLLGRVRLGGDSIHKLVCQLSVGERTKAEIVSLLMSSVNVLVLDEPTNHLDIESLEALEGALQEFPGSVIFTSHDRRFIETLADQIVEIPLTKGR